VRLATDVIDQATGSEEVDDLVEAVTSQYWFVVDLFASVGNLPWSLARQFDGDKPNSRAIASSIVEVVGDWAVAVGR
jgi:hypothetical protein